MAQTEEVLAALVNAIEALDKRIQAQEERLTSLSKWLTIAFCEQGFDFAKIARLESSRHKEEIQNDTTVLMDAEDADTKVQDEIAKAILRGETLNSESEIIAAISSGLFIEEFPFVPETKPVFEWQEHDEKLAEELRKNPRYFIDKASNKGRKQ